MPIILARIDDRLIHGQIVQGWLKNISVEKILVASDMAAKDLLSQTLMGMALPDNVALEVKTVDAAAASIIAGNYDKMKTMLLVSSPHDILRIIEKGADIKSVNIGGMHFTPGKKQLACNICVNCEDIVDLHSIYLKGIEIEGRVLPLDERTNIIPIVENEYCKLEGYK